jgi:acetyltransferase-like isoleucine patch superfamily enzyme
MYNFLSFIRKVFFAPMALLNCLILKLSNVKYTKLIINGLLFVSNSGTITIGRNVVINSSKYKNIIGGDHRTSLVVKNNALLLIGDNVRISNSAIYAARSVVIGENTMIGGSSKIWDTDFHSLNSMERLKNPNLNYKSEGITIGKNVFIGGFTMILKGVNIGDEAIIGAGSVVSKDIPAGEIWAGNPARFIRKLK